MLRRTLPILFVLLIILTTGCGSESTQSVPEDGPFLTFTDGLDRRVVLNAAPERVVSIAPGATHVVRAAGGLGSLVAVTTADYNDADLEGLERVSALPLDLEAIIALDPDLILASDQVNDPAHAELFEALNVPIAYLGSDTWEDVSTSIVLTGRMLRSEDLAEAAADSLQAEREALAAITSQIEVPPTSIFLISPITSYSFGKGSYVLDLMRLAGLNPLTETFETPAPVLDDEWVLLMNPDVIVGTFGDMDPVASLLENHPSWRSLDAIKQGKVVDVPVPSILTPGPENVRAAWHMAMKVHPELFSGMNQKSSN